jgi:cytochrome c oxidase subunit 2
MAYIVVKFNAKANPTPTKTTHNSLLEVLWTVIPILILIGITIPSLKLLYYTDRTPDPEMTIKVVGNQWYWSYVYLDHGEFEFDSYILDDDELEEGQPPLLSVDEPVVLPVGTNIRILVVSNDVIHNFAVPSLGLKLDTTPGRTNETWVNINEPGDYYGMCSELCGVNHGFMPIHVKALSKEDFAAWVVEANEEFASNDDTEVDLIQLASDATLSIPQTISQ